MCCKLHVQILSYISPQNAFNYATSSCSKEQTMSNLLHSQQIFQITEWIHIIYNEINSQGNLHKVCCHRGTITHILQNEGT